MGFPQHWEKRCIGRIDLIQYRHTCLRGLNAQHSTTFIKYFTTYNTSFHCIAHMARCSPPWSISPQHATPHSLGCAVRCSFVFVRASTASFETTSTMLLENLTPYENLIIESYQRPCASYHNNSFVFYGVLRKTVLKAAT